MCGVEHQSPIDITPNAAIFNLDVCDSTFDWQVNFDVTTFKINNNGHSVSLKAVKQMDIDPDLDYVSTIVDADGVEYETLSENENAIATLPNYFKPDNSAHDSFCLDSLHFHWGLNDQTGSEHLLDGDQFPLEVHFVHYSCSHSTLAATLEQFPSMESVTEAESNGDDTHQLGVVGIFFDVVDDRRNPAFDAIFTNETLNDIMYPSSLHSHDSPISGVAASTIVSGLDLSDLIPDNAWTAGYYAYEGSLTTPPCTDIVRWHVMNARSYIGRDQLEYFRALMSTEEYPIAPNFRVIQDNPNTVYGCMGAEADSDEDDKENTSDEPMSWWAVAIISSVVTALVMGIIFFFMRKKEEKQIEEVNDVSAKRKRTNSDIWTNGGATPTR